MSDPQPGILADVPSVARYVTFRLRHGADARPSLEAVADRSADGSVVLGLGRSLALALGTPVDGHRVFEPHVGAGFEVPATPSALWAWLRGDDRGDLVLATRSLRDALAPAFEATEVVDAFVHRDSRDLSGYEDGTENPKGDDAAKAALRDDGSSLVAVQKWVHDMRRLQSFPQKERDDHIGRRLSDNVEFEGAPPSAHVKRTAQESFDPEAFVLRRSMPWNDADDEGLVFVAFGHSLDAFETLLRHMVGADDGIVDALFEFTRPVTGANFWCPPLSNGRLDLSAL